MRCAIALDTGGTTIKGAVVGEDGKILTHATAPTPREPEAYLQQLAALAGQLERQVTDSLPPADESDQATVAVAAPTLISTVGIDAPGIVSEATGSVEYSASLGWRDFAVREKASQALQRPVAFGHDVRSGALAESHFGAGHQDFFYVAIGTGIASVLVLNGTPVATTSWIGELGQIRVPDVNGQLVRLEAVCSAAAIARNAQTLNLVDADAGSAQVYALADRGNPQAQRVIDFATDTLAQALAPVVSVIGAVPIVLGGGLTNRGQRLYDELAAALSRYLGEVPAPTIEGARLGSWSQAQGAALRAFAAEPYRPQE